MSQKKHSNRNSATIGSNLSLIHAHGSYVCMIFQLNTNKYINPKFIYCNFNQFKFTYSLARTQDSSKIRYYNIIWPFAYQSTNLDQNLEDKKCLSRENKKKGQNEVEYIRLGYVQQG